MINDEEIPDFKLFCRTTETKTVWCCTKTDMYINGIEQKEQK
jgi:hypothetical protein